MTQKFYQQAWPEGEYRFMQMAWLVNDLEQSAQKWVDVYGVGPFYIMPTMGAQTTSYRGGTTKFEMQIAVSQAGPMQIELICAPGKEASIFRDLYAQGETGVHHMASIVDDYDTAKAHYENLGYVVASELETASGRVAYIDTTADFGIFTEVVEHSEQFAKALRGTSRVCGKWDGVDPVRIINEKGYSTPTT